MIVVFFLSFIFGSFVTTQNSTKAQAASIPTITEFPLNSPGSAASSITSGPDRNLWATGIQGNHVWEITTDGIIKPFKVPAGGAEITSGSDGNLWYSDVYGNKIDRLTPSGVNTPFPISTLNSAPWGVTLGSNGNVWFAESSGNKIGEITPQGAITEFAIPTYNSQPFAITTGPDGNIWFAESVGNKIGKISISGIITEYQIPTASSTPYDIKGGKDGNVWFVEYNAKKIGKMTPNGDIIEYSLSTISGLGEVESRITLGPDGNIWFGYSSSTHGYWAEITPGGAISEVTVTSNLGEMTTGPDGKIWFASEEQIGRINIAQISARSKLVVVVQGLDSSLSTNNIADNNGYGTVSGFGTIVSNLQKTAEFKTNTQFMAFSYKGSQPHTDGKPLIYGCKDTYANPIMLDESNLKAQISLYLTKRPNTDVYIFSHSLGGVVTFAYVADLVKKNLHSLSLGGGSVLKGVAIADSPIGGIIDNLSYEKLIIGKALACNIAPNDMVAIHDLITLKTKIPWSSSFEGLSASIYTTILNKGKGTYVTNQEVAGTAENLGLRLLIVGNEYDLLWHPNVCGQGSNFGNTEYMVELGKGSSNGGALYARSFKSGSLSPLECRIDKLFKYKAFHMDVLSNTDVSTVVWEVFTDRKVDKLTPVTLSHKP